MTIKDILDKVDEARGEIDVDDTYSVGELITQLEKVDSALSDIMDEYEYVIKDVEKVKEAFDALEELIG